MVYFSLLIFSIILLTGCSADRKNSMTGIYLESINGHNIIINDISGPIVMDNETSEENIFDELKNGDKIEITYDSIKESYPAQTQIYSFKLIEKGTTNDVPKYVLDKLQELGWEFDLSN